MKGSDLTDKQLGAAARYILLRRASGNHVSPSDDELVEIRWKELVMLIAEYGAIRAGSVAKGGSVNEPGEIYLTAEAGRNSPAKRGPSPEPAQKGKADADCH